MLLMPSVKLPCTGYHLILDAGSADPCSAYQVGDSFTVSVQVSVFWLGLFMPELPLLRSFLIACEPCMEKLSQCALLCLPLVR